MQKAQQYQPTRTRNLEPLVSHRPDLAVLMEQTTRVFNERKPVIP